MLCLICSGRKSKSNIGMFDPPRQFVISNQSDSSFQSKRITVFYIKICLPKICRRNKSIKMCPQKQNQGAAETKTTVRRNKTEMCFCQNLSAETKWWGRRNKNDGPQKHRRNKTDRRNTPDHRNARRNKNVAAETTAETKMAPQKHPQKQKKSKS